MTETQTQAQQLRQYIYTPSEMGLSKFSDGILRLNLPETRNPLEADLFVCPEPLFKLIGHADISRYCFYANRVSSPHVFLDLSEHFTHKEPAPHIFIRAALTRDMLEKGHNSIAWPWPVKDLRGDLQTSPYEVDVTFHGWLSCLARKVSVKACAESDLVTADIATYRDFYGYQKPTEQKQRWDDMLKGLSRARMALSVESIPGVIPYRFYEAMSAGRCQLYIGRNYNLPFADVIPYDEFITRLDTDAAMEADQAVKDWLTRYDDKELRERGELAYRMWKQYLAPDVWVDTMTAAVVKKVEALCGA